MRIIARHICPNCRIARPGWDVKGTKAKGDFRIGQTLSPELLSELFAEAVPETLFVSDKCEACKQMMQGELRVNPENGRLVAIRDLATAGRHK